MIISSSHSEADMEVFPVILRLQCKVQGSYKKSSQRKHDSMANLVNNVRTSSCKPLPLALPSLFLLDLG